MQEIIFQLSTERNLGNQVIKNQKKEIEELKQQIQELKQQKQAS